MRNITLMFVILGFLLSGCDRDNTTLVAPEIDASTTPDEFLQFINKFDSLGQSEIDSAAYANKYYETVDPNMERTTLADWKTKNGFGAGDTHATFRDAKDLGYGRDMFARTGSQSSVPGPPALPGLPNCTGVTAIYVDSYVVELLPGDATTYGPINLDAAINKDSRYLIGTNAIEFGPEDPMNCGTPPIAKFFTFGPPDANGVQHRILKADLDGRGVKYMPTVCATCHGGTMYPLTIDGEFNPISLKSLKMHILEQDTIEFSPLAGFRETDQQNAIKQINKMIFDTYVVMGNRTDSAPDPGPPSIPADRANWDSDFAEKLIEYAYGDPNPGDDNLVQNTDYQAGQVPAGWASQSTPPTAMSTSDALYQQVIAPHCIGCHSLRGNQRNDSTNFSSYFDIASYNDQTIRYVYQYATMPGSLINYSQFWGDPAKPTLLASHLDIVTNFPNLDPVMNAIVEPGKPVAVPGADRSVNSAAAIQDATASKFTTDYLWKVLSMNATLDDPTSSAPVITAIVPPPPMMTTTVDLELTTSNSLGSSFPVAVSITIDDTPPPPAFPTFNPNITDIFTSSCIGCHGASSTLPVALAGTSQELYRNVLDRVNLADPENSLLLRKGSRQVPHGSNNLLGSDYNTVLNWIRSGAP